MPAFYVDRDNVDLVVDILEQKGISLLAVVQVYGPGSPSGHFYASKRNAEETN